MDKGSRSANDDRSDSMNSNNPAYDASVENRADQLNPDHEASREAENDEEED